MSLNKVVRSYLCAASSLTLCGAMSVLATQPAMGQELYGSETGMVREVREFRVRLPFENAARAVTTEVVDNVVVYEGDIVLGTVEELQRDNPFTTSPKVGGGAHTRGVIIDGSRYRWASSVIPYSIPSNHPQRARIEAAIQMVQDTTNLCMVPRTTQSDYVNFVNGSGCSSYVGRRGGGQSITIGSCSTGSIAHEIFHAAGLFHEQSREDRNNFITVHLENVEAGKEHNFDRHVSDATDYSTYNYGSIMHYGATAFSKNGLPTIVVKTQPGSATPTIGQRNAPSSGDVRAINSIYSVNSSAACR